MKSNWTTVRLGDMCEIKNGYAFKSKDFASSGVPVIKIKNVKPNQIIESDFSYIPETIAEEKSKWLIRKGDILLTMTGNRADGSPESWVGKAALFTLESKYLLNQRVAAITSNHKELDTEYLGYYLSSWESQLYFIKRSNSSGGQANISPDIVRNYIIALPPLEEQLKIVGILKTIDARIKNNYDINDNLAELLQTIYQERFGNVSSATIQGNLSDLCSYSRDRVPVSALDTNTYFSTENMLPEKTGATEATSLPTTSQTTACHKGDTLVSNIRPYFKKIVYCEDNCGCSTDVLCFTPVQPKYAAYLFSTLYADKFFAFMVAGSKGTKMPRGDKQQIMSYPVTLPSDDELDEFNALALPILAQYHSNRVENKRLSATRDALLPKLMSGEIDISGIQF